MRIFVLFDLPTITERDKREYRYFHKFLLKDGFIMMQQSVYTKIALNNTVAEVIKARVRKNKPKKGLVQMLSITEKQFSKMECIIGETQNKVIDSDKRLIIL